MANIYVVIGICFLTFATALNPNHLDARNVDSEDTSSVQYDSTTFQYETTTLDEWNDGKDELCGKAGYTLPPAYESTTLPYDDTTQQEDEEISVLKEEDYIEGCACGIQQSRSSRIIGGGDAAVNEFPWFVVLALKSGDDDDFFYCGGAIINDRTILTAASCGDEPASKYYVRLNVHNYDKTEGVNRTVKRLINHPKFHPCGDEHDIALMELDEPLELGDNYISVCLPTYTPLQTEEEKLKDGDLLTIIGFGTTTVGNHTEPKRLQKLDLPYFSPEECNKTGNIGHFTENMICAGHLESGKDSCHGDGGGPLTRIENGIAVQHGIDAFGNGCAKKGFVALYTKISNYIPWIMRSTPAGAKWCRKVDPTKITGTSKIPPIPEVFKPTDDPVLNSIFENEI